LNALTNRLYKNHKKFAKFFAKKKIQAYRLYDRDIPEAPIIIDLYHDHAVVFERFNEQLDPLEKQIAIRTEVISALTALGVKPENSIFKARNKQLGHTQYEKLSRTGKQLKIFEGETQYIVNLHDYLDTGLFLDHRPLREKIKAAHYRGKTFLNLFSYTGSVSVAAAQAGAIVTSVDSSQTYLKWASDNFKVNHLDPTTHQFVCDDVLQYLERPQNKLFDRIFLDPPSFSNSKKFARDFDMQRDHPLLIKLCLKNLNSDGILYFSTNLRSFTLDPALITIACIKDITQETIPLDFRDKKIHHCYRITQREL